MVHVKDSFLSRGGDVTPSLTVNHCHRVNTLKIEKIKFILVINLHLKPL